MINRPSLEKKRKFAIELQKQREAIIAKHTPITRKVYKHIIKKARRFLLCDTIYVLKLHSASSQK